MSRRLIIILLIILVVGVIGGAAVLVMNRLQQGAPGEPTPAAGELGEAERGGQNIVNPGGDEDGDGLVNADESLWGSDAKNPDTDGDGFLDGEEVKANYNPTLPSPSDKLPEGFVPGKDLQPIDTVPTQPVAVDQFFQDNLDLTLGTRNYTEEYKQQFNEAARTSQSLLTFAKTQPVVTQLPKPADKAIQIATTDSPASLDAYLSSVGSINIFSNRNLFSIAINDLFGRHDTSTIAGVAIMMRLYQEELIETSVPPAAVNLHKLLLGYSQMLSATMDQMARYNEDSVRAIVAMRQWEENDRKYIPLIEQEFDRLRAVAALGQ